MAELIITSKEDVEKIFINFLDKLVKSKAIIFDPENDEKLNQKQAAEYLGITQSTLIRWKKNGLVPCDQLAGSSKVTYFKSQLKAVLQRNPTLLQPPRK